VARPQDTLGLPAWSRVVLLVAVVGLGVAAWRWLSETPVDLQEFAASLTSHRDAWYALPAVILAFVALGLAMVPVLLLITATGIAFGPVLGPLYAMLGSLASASIGFAIGRWVGPRRVEYWGGERIRRVTGALRRNGTLAVYLIRKVPAPFTLVNIVVGASTVRYRDFLVGTLLGMLAIVVALAGFGYQLTELLREPSPQGLMVAGLFVLVPLTIAWIINRALRRARPLE
jgi:uncharacterized membrane protein YdjX (TVP38/TMEM64 family)